MNVKRMSLRFNLENESDRKAWKHLQSIPDSKNKAVIDALNTSSQQENSIRELIRQTIRECLSAGTFVPVDIPLQTTEATVSEDEAALLDAMDAFMGD